MAVNKLHPVGVLIEAVKAVEEWSDTDLARRAERAGYRISKSRISQMRTEPVRSVSPDNIATLAAALGVPAERVVRAYLDAMGYPLPEQPRSGVEEAIRADGRLSSDDKESLLALLRVMRSRRLGPSEPAAEVSKPRRRRGRTSAPPDPESAEGTSDPAAVEVPSRTSGPKS